jgi:hypothetical protein
MDCRPLHIWLLAAAFSIGWVIALVFGELILRNKYDPFPVSVLAP